MKVLLAVYGLMSVLTFVQYAVDKFLAKAGFGKRLREARLLLFGFFGGAAGALLAMLLFRHKTRHRSFWIVNSVGLMLQLALLYFVSKEFPLI